MSKKYFWRLIPKTPLNQLTIFFVIPLLVVACKNDSEGIDNVENEETSEVDTLGANEADAIITEETLPPIETPSGYHVLTEAEGDLDGDDISEKVIVYNTDRTVEFGTEREMRIYVQHEGLWSLWHTSVGPILPSEQGGMMGDPFEKMEIINGRIAISHFGGSGEKWSYTHEFYYTDEHEWRVAEAVLVFFRNCEFNETFTFDMIKKSGFQTRTRKACNSDGEVIESVKEIEYPFTIYSGQESPLMDGFKPGENEIRIKNDEALLYL